MQAVIFAAGKGTRMRPLTNTTPKSLLQVNGVSILEHNLRQLVGLVDEVILVVGYKGEMITEAIGDSFEGMKITYVWQKEQLGTGDAACQALSLLEDSCLFMNGDDLYNKADLELLLKRFPAVMAAQVDNPELFGVFTTTEDRVVDLVEKPSNPQSNLVNIGAYYLPSAILAASIHESARGEYEFTDYVKMYLEKNPLYFCIAKKWFPIADPESLVVAEDFLTQ